MHALRRPILPFVVLAVGLLLSLTAILQLARRYVNNESAAAPHANGGMRLIVDTDAGTDDLIAIALLSADTSVVLEAVTVVDGLSSVSAGVNTVHRLLRERFTTG